MGIRHKIKFDLTFIMISNHTI